MTCEIEDEPDPPQDFFPNSDESKMVDIIKVWAKENTQSAVISKSH